MRRLVRDADLVHYPLTVPSPRAPKGRPFVQTLLDTQHHDLRHNFAATELLYRRLRYDVPAKRAAAVITISEFCKQQIVSNLDIDPARVHVAHLGVTPRSSSQHGAARALRPLSRTRLAPQESSPPHRCDGDRPHVTPRP